LAQHRIGVRNSFAADQITQMIPWTSLAWTQVHSGQLPLWNPYNALGVPLAFNWQSATFSLPALLGYMAPLRLAYTVQVLATLVVGGTGIYMFARVLRLNVVACALAGTVFGLSGSFLGWLGWPVTSVMSWTGWLLAATVLTLRGGGRRAASVALFSVALAFAVYAGEPDTLALVLASLAVFVIVMVIMGMPDRHGPRGLRPLVDLVLATVAGLALSAPLLLPGLQLLSGSGRDVAAFVKSGQKALSVHRLVTLAVPGLDGLPIAWHRSYIGLIAVALAAAGWIRYRRRPEVTAVGAVAVVAALVCFVPPVLSVLNALPGLGAVRWPRMVNVLELAIAVLCGVGLDVLIRSYRERAVLRLFEAVFAVAGLGVFVLWALRPREGPVRADNLLWAGTAAGLGLVVLGGLEWARWKGVGVQFSGSDVAMASTGLESSRNEPGQSQDKRRMMGTGPKRSGLRSPGLWAALVLVAFQTAFLIAMGSSQWSSNSTSFTTTPAVGKLKQAVGPSLVGLGKRACQSANGTLGIPVNTNVVFGVSELATYDPMLPRTYYKAWTLASGKVGGFPSTSRYCPAVTTTALARLYGVSFVLEPKGTSGPTGAIFDTAVGNEDLYRIPGAASATLVPSHSGRPPSLDAKGRPVPVTHPKARSWRLVVDVAHPQELRLRLTDVPGWHATIDGHSLSLEPYAGVMLQAQIPPGHHVIELSYWPTAFTVGIALAVLSALALVLYPFLGLVFRRRLSRNHRSPDVDSEIAS